jgi:hypothetical protein
MKWIQLIRQLTKIASLMLTNENKRKLLILCQSGEINKQVVEGKPILTLKLDSHVVSVYSYNKGKLDALDLLGKVNTDILRKM